MKLFCLTSLSAQNSEEIFERSRSNELQTRMNLVIRVRFQRHR